RARAGAVFWQCASAAACDGRRPRRRRGGVHCQLRPDHGRGGPVMLSARTREEIQRVVGRFPERRSALLPALKLAQRDAGWLPEEAIAEAADRVGVPPAAALELAMFYTMLHTEPVPPTRIVVCAQLPCALRGAEGLIRELRQAFEGSERVEVERTSECFGA